jgi:hypothetical protein
MPCYPKWKTVTACRLCDFIFNIFTKAELGDGRRARWDVFEGRNPSQDGSMTTSLFSSILSLVLCACHRDGGPSKRAAATNIKQQARTSIRHFPAFICGRQCIRKFDGLAANSKQYRPKFRSYDELHDRSNAPLR